MANDMGGWTVDHGTKRYTTERGRRGGEIRKNTSGNVARGRVEVAIARAAHLEVCPQSCLNLLLVAGPQSDFGGIYGELFSTASPRFTCCDGSVFRGGDGCASARPGSE